MIFKQHQMNGWLAQKRQGAHAPVLGERELAVLEILWQSSSLSAQQIHTAQPSVTPISLNTVQSTIERLYRKRLVARKKVGRSFLYTAVCSKQSIIGDLLEDIARDVAGGDTASMISAFMGFIHNHPAIEPDQLQKAIANDDNA